MSVKNKNKQTIKGKQWEKCIKCTHTTAAAFCCHCWVGFLLIIANNHSSSLKRQIRGKQICWCESVDGETGPKYRGGAGLASERLKQYNSLTAHSNLGSFTQRPQCSGCLEVRFLSNFFCSPFMWVTASGGHYSKQ